MIEFSCHTWGFNDLTLPEALATIARLGFRYVDIGTGQHINTARAAHPNTRDEVIRQILADLSAFNLKVADLYLMLPRISVVDDEKRQRDILMFKALLPFAKALNTKGITVSAGLTHPEDDEDALNRSVSALQEMVEVAKQVDIPLSVEPHLDSMIQTPEQALEIVDKVEGLQLTLDWAQLVTQKFRLNQIVKLLPHTRHIHIRQAASEKLQTPFKKGKINLEYIMKSLLDEDYQGLVCVEYMQTIGWHGMMEVNSIVECATLRDALRELRDEQALVEG